MSASAVDSSSFVTTSSEDSSENTHTKKSTGEEASFGKSKSHRPAPCLKKTICQKKLAESVSEAISSSPESSGGVSTSSISQPESCRKKTTRTDATPASSEQSNISSLDNTEEDASSNIQSSEQSTSAQVSEKYSEEEVASNHDSTGTASGEVNIPQDSCARTATSDSTTGLGWSLSEDALLQAMKLGSESLSWADIGKALQKSKSEVKARWKAIKDLPHKAGSSDDGNEHQGTEETKKFKTSPEAPEIRVKEKQDHNSSTKLVDRTPETPAEVLLGAAEMKYLSGDEASSEASRESMHIRKPDSKRRQDRYLRDHIWSELYPSSARLTRDEVFGAKDYAVLAAADSKYKCSRWLEMQADFFNVTGRMVPLDIIRAKCEELNADDEELPARTRAVKQWVYSMDKES